MSEIVDRSFEMFIMFIVGLAIGGCFMYFNMKDKAEIPNGSNVPDEFLVTENDVDSSEFYATV